MISRRFVFVPSVLLGLLGCSGGGPDLDEPPTDISTSTRELLTADQAFAALSDSTDARTAFAAYLDPGAILLPRSGEPREGLTAALDALGDASAYRLLWQPQFAEVAASDDFGWTWGTYQVVVEGEEVSRGKYVNVWRRQPDGAWKVRLDMGNVEPAAE